MAWYEKKKKDEEQKTSSWMKEKEEPVNKTGSESSSAIKRAGMGSRLGKAPASRTGTDSINKDQTAVRRAGIRKTVFGTDRKFSSDYSADEDLLELADEVFHGVAGNDTRGKSDAIYFQYKYGDLDYQKTMDVLNDPKTGRREYEWAKHNLLTNSKLHESMTAEQLGDLQAETDTEIQRLNAQIQEQIERQQMKPGIYDWRKDPEIQALNQQIEDAKTWSKGLGTARNLAERREALSANEQKWLNDPDIDAKAEAGQALENPDWWAFFLYDGGDERQEEMPQVNNPLEFYLQNMDYLEDPDLSLRASDSFRDAVGRGTQGGWEYVTDEQRKIANAIAASEGAEAQLEYLQSIRDELGEKMLRGRQEDIDAVRAAAQEQGGLAGFLTDTGLTAGSWVGNVYGRPLAMIENGISAITGQGVNPYSPMNMAVQTSQYIQQTIKDDIGEGKLGKVGQFAYDVVNATVENVLGATTLGRGYTVAMSMGAANETANEWYENGEPPENILGGAVTSALIAYATESYGVENFVGQFLEGNVAGWGDLLLKALAQGGIEVSEDMAENILTPIRDAILQTGMSDNEEAVEALVAKGWERDAAERKVFTDGVMEAIRGYGISFASAALGGGMAGAPNAMATNRMYEDVGGQIYENRAAESVIQNAQEVSEGGTDIKQRLIDLARRKAAINLKRNGDSGQVTRGAKRAVGKLAMATDTAIQNSIDTARENESRASRDAFQAAAQDRLTEKGIVDPDKAAKALTEAVFDGKDSQRAQDAGGVEVINEILNSRKYLDGIKRNKQNAQEKIRQAEQLQEKSRQSMTEESEAHKERGRQAGEREAFTEFAKQELDEAGIVNAAQAAQIIAKEKYGERLTKDEQKIFEAVKGAEVQQRIAQNADYQAEMQERGQVRQEIRSTDLQRRAFARAMPKTAAEERQRVLDTVREMGDSSLDADAAAAVFKDGQNAVEFLRAYENAFEMGREDVGLPNAVNANSVRYLDRDQIKAAYEAGRKDAANEKRSVQSGTEWNDRAFTGREARAVEAGTAAEAEREQAAERAAGSNAEGQVSAAELNIPGGTKNKVLRVRSEENYTEADKAAAKTAKDNGLECVIVEGNSIQTTENVGGKNIMIKARAVITGNRIIVRADDQLFTADAIAKHEVTHKQIERGEVSTADAMERIRSRYTEDEIAEIVQLYADAYGDTGMTAEEVMEEIVCDAAAGMNAFAVERAKNYTGQVGVFLRNVQRAVEAGRRTVGTEDRNRAEQTRTTVKREAKKTEPETGAIPEAETKTREAPKTEAKAEQSTANWEITEDGYKKFRSGIDSDGRTLTDEQKNSFQYSQVRDKDGNLKVVYKVTDWEFTEKKPNENAEPYYIDIPKMVTEAEYKKAKGSAKSEDFIGAYGDRMYREGYDGAHTGEGKYIIWDASQARPVSDKAAKFSRETVREAEQEVRPKLEGKQDRDEFYTRSEGTQMVGNVQQEIQKSTQFDEKYMQAAIEENQKRNKVGEDLLAAAAAIRADMAQQMRKLEADKKIGLPKDVLGKTYFANSSYDGSEENTTICPRSLTSEAFVDAVSEMLGRPLTVAEQVYISQDLQNRTTTPECLYCYVATDRKAYREFLGSYIQQRDAVLEKVKAGETDMDKLYQEFLDGRKPTANMRKRFDLWVNTYRDGKQMISANDLTNMQKLMGDLESEFGAELKEQIKDAMAYAQSASWAKKRVNYVAYNNHILKWSDDRIRKLNSHYGLRMYSFSDFHPAFILENMQMITDASVRGLKMLAYTKDTDFVRIFAKTGMNINVSCFGIERNGAIAENNLIGANWEEAQQLRAENPNVGITFVATNDKLVDWALKQPWIDVVIPYHLVRTGAEVAKALNYTNYTSESGDGKAADWAEWAADKNKKKLIRSIPPTMHNNDKATYLQALKDNHLTPRFERYLKNPNYMKLVNECRRSASESEPVKPIFDKQAADAAMMKLKGNGYYTPIGGDVEHMYEIAHQVSEEIQKGVKFSREMQTMEDLRRTNSYLKRQLEETRKRFKEEMQLTAGPSANKEDVRDLARDLLEEYGSHNRLGRTAEYLQDIADRIIGDKEPSWQSLREKAKEAAEYILEGSSPDMDADEQELLKDVRFTMRGIQINADASVREKIGDWEAFQKRNSKRMRFAEDGRSIQSVWEELQETYGQRYFPGEVTGDAERLKHIETILQSDRVSKMNPYATRWGTTIEQMTDEILYELMSDRIRQRAKTKADRIAEDVMYDAYREGYRAAAKKKESYYQGQLERKEEYFQGRIERKEAYIQELIERNKERNRERVQRARETEIRNKIANLEKGFERMAANRGKAATMHAPPELMRYVRDFCQLFNESSLGGANRQDAKIAERAQELTKRAEREGVTEAVLAEAAKLGRLTDANERAKQRLAEAVAAYAALKDESVVYNENVETLLHELRALLESKSIREMNAKELEQVYTAMKALQQTVVEANNAFSMGQNKHVTEMAEKSLGEIRQVNYTAPGFQSAKQQFLLKQMTPDVAFNYMFGFIKDNEGQVIQKAFVQGEERMMRMMQERDDLFRGILQSRDKNVQQHLKALMHPDGKKNFVKFGLKDRAGNEVSVSRGMMMQVYMMLRQEDSHRSLLFSGFRLPNAEVYYDGKRDAAYGNMEDTALLSEALHEDYYELVAQRNEIGKQLDELEEPLKNASKEEKDAYYAKRDELFGQLKEIKDKAAPIIADREVQLKDMQDRIWEMMNSTEKQLIDLADQWYTHSGQMMRQTFLRMNGFEPKLVENYVPIHRDPSSLVTDIREPGQAQKALNLENTGATKERVRSNKPILLTDFFVELDQSAKQISRYVGFAEVQKDFNKIWNVNVQGTNLKTMIEARFGAGKGFVTTSGTEYINKYIMDIAGGSRTDNGLAGLYGNYAASTLRLNPRVAISQAASIPTAAAVVGWKNAGIGFAKGLPKAFSTSYKNELAKKNAFFAQRYQGEGANAEYSDFLRKRGWVDTAAESKVGKMLFNWCQNVDVFSTGAIMNEMAAAQVRENGMRPGQEGYEAAVNQMYTDILRKSQPNYTVTERSDLLRDKRTEMKFLTMFKTQSNQNLNILMAANCEFIRMRADLKNKRNGVTAADVTAAQKKLANAYTSVILGGTVGFVLLRTLANFLMRTVKSYVDDDTGEIEASAVAGAMLKEAGSSMAGMIAMGGPLYDIVYSVVSGEKYYGISDSAFSAMAAAGENFVKLVQDWEQGKDITADMIWKNMESLGMLKGIPVGNVKKMYKAVSGWWEDFRKGDLYSSTGADPTKKQYYARLLQAYEAGDDAKGESILAALLAMTDATSEMRGEDQVESGVTTFLKGKYLDGSVDMEYVRDLMGTYFQMGAAELDTTEMKWLGIKETGMTESDLKKDYFRGKVSSEEYIAYLVKYLGKSEADAEAAELKQRCERDEGIVYSNLEELLHKRKITEQKVREIVVKYGGKDADKADETLTKWKFKEYHPEISSPSNNLASGYLELVAKDKNLAERFVDAYTFKSHVTGDKDDNGKTISGSAKAKVVSYIESLPGLTKAQRKMIWDAIKGNWADKGTPWA